VTLEPFERDHACVVGGYRMPKKQKWAWEVAVLCLPSVLIRCSSSIITPYVLGFCGNETMVAVCCPATWFMLNLIWAEMVILYTFKPLAAAITLLVRQASIVIGGTDGDCLFFMAIFGRQFFFWREIAFHLNF
jgi:hypothetical protein